MFSINPFYQPSSESSLYNLDSLIKYLNDVQQQQIEQSRPKIIKKIESEDNYQIQIFKKFGSFESYEVRAVKNPRFENLINVVIESRTDNFKKVFNFNLDDINLDEINWEWYKDENVLVLNIPKKRRICCDSLEFGLPGFFNVNYPFYYQDHLLKSNNSKESQMEERRKMERRELERREMERREMERREMERREMERREMERREDELKARKVAEEKAKARREAREKEGQERERKEREIQQSLMKQQQEFLRQIFGNFVPHPYEYQPQELARKEEIKQEEPRKPELPKQEEKPQKEEKPEMVEELMQEDQPKIELPKADAGKEEVSTQPEKYESDAISINSEPEATLMSTSHSSALSSAADQTSPPSKQEKNTPTSDMHDLHRHPSIEEVEDEEFVMFRKKFGQ